MCSKSGVNKLWTAGQVWPTTCFSKFFLLEHSHVHWFTYVSPGAAFLPQGRAEQLQQRPTTLEIFTIWLFTEKVCGHLCEVFGPSALNIVDAQYLLLNE